MDTRDDGAADTDGRRDAATADTDADVDRRGGPDRTPSDPRAEQSADADPVRVSDARDDGNGEVGIAEAVGEDRPPLGPLEPGSPTPENVLFVVLGALATVALVATLL